MNRDELWFARQNTPSLIERVNKKTKRYPGLNRLLRVIHLYLIRPVITIGITFTAVVRVVNFLVSNRSIFRQDIIFILYHDSFGHQVRALDMVSRLWYPERISLIQVLTKRNNHILPECFQHNINPFLWDGWFWLDNDFYQYISYRVMRCFCLIITAFSKRHQIISFSRETAQLYGMVSMAKGTKLLAYKEGNNTIDERPDITGYFRLLGDSIGKKPKLPSGLKRECENAIKAKIPEFFEKPFVCLSIRKQRSYEYSDYLRDGGDPHTYKKAVRWLVKNGFNVVGGGDTSDEEFSDINGFYSITRLGVDADLINLYSLMHASLYIGQHNGAYHLPMSVGIKMVLCNSFPFYTGTVSKKDLVLFKRVIYKGNLLSLSEIFKNHPDLIYGGGMDQPEYEIRFNTEDEILAAVQGKGAVRKKFKNNTLFFYEKSLLIDPDL